jgi:transposase-like protein
MSPSPQWCHNTEVPLFQALTAAQHDAWHAPDEESARRIFADRVRQLVGPARADTILLSALSLFNTQLRAPDGFVEPPSTTSFAICPRCQTVKKTKFTIPQNGRLKLVALRDREWLQQQFERRRTCAAIAQQLDCSPSLVMDWARKHDLLPSRTARTEEFDSEVRARHHNGEAPGEIASALEVKVQDVRKSLVRQELATQKRGHHYFQPEWWIERIERRGWTTRQCARAAGIQPHNCAYYLNRFGLDHITKARRLKKGERRCPKYPALADATQLAELLREHGTYEAVAKAVGCPSPSLVSRWARELLGVGKRHENFKPTHAQSWWTERLDAGMTTWQLAEEAGITEKAVRERLRVFDPKLLAQGYRNNTIAERAKRRPKRPDWIRGEARSA